MITFEQFYETFILNEIGYTVTSNPLEVIYTTHQKFSDINEPNVYSKSIKGELTVCGYNLTKDADVTTHGNVQEPKSQVITKSAKKSYEQGNYVYDYIPTIPSIQNELALKDLIDRFETVTIDVPTYVAKANKKIAVNIKAVRIFDKIEAIIPLPSSSNFSTAIAHEMLNRINANRENNVEIFNHFKKMTYGDIRQQIPNFAAMQLAFNEQRLTPDQTENIDRILINTLFRANYNQNNNIIIAAILKNIREQIFNENNADNKQISSKRFIGHPYRDSYVEHPIVLNPASNFSINILTEYKQRLNNILPEQYQSWWDKDEKNLAAIKNNIRDILMKANKSNGIDIAICDDDTVKGESQKRVIELLQDIKTEIHNMFAKINFNPSDNNNRYQLRIHKFYAFCKKG